MIKESLIITMAMAASLLNGGPAYAVTNNVIQPISVDSSVDFFSTSSHSQLINQLNNLTCHNNMMHSVNFGTCVFTTESTNNVQLTFVFPDVQNINAFLLWNGRLSSGINSFQLFVDEDSDRSNGLGNQIGNSFNANRETGFSVPAQRFTFTPTRTRYVHLNIISNHGSNDFLSAGEIAFEEVPFENTPISGIIFLLGARAMNYFRRLKKNS